MKHKERDRVIMTNSEKVVALILLILFIAIVLIYGIIVEHNREIHARDVEVRQQIEQPDQDQAELLREIRLLERERDVLKAVIEK